ncbi:MAG TPA: hypothetical protein VFN62_12965 [Acidobacteriaceae bacterium]|nr:hypothetical protein [Acidobacteriaceae bacterium]
MRFDEFKASVTHQEPASGLSIPLLALWWDMKGEWTQAHSLVDELETKDGMAVHAYLHRKQGQTANAEYWYQRAGREFYRPDLADEWQTLAGALLSSAK